MKKEADILTLASGLATSPMLFLTAKLWSSKLLRSSLFIAFSLLLNTTSFSQKTIDFIAGDNLGNVYTVTKTDTLRKYTPDLKSTYNYSNKTLGKIGAVNTQNPLKILVSHPGLSTLVVMDVTLRETGRIFLPDLGIFSDSLAFCLSNENNIYLYDDYEQQVITVTEDGREVSRSPSLFQEVGYPPRVSSMAFENNILYLNDPDNGVLMLDQFGKYIKTLPLKGLHHFQVIGNKLFYVENQKLLSYNTRYFDKQEVYTFPETISQAIIGNKRLLAVKNGELQVIGN